MAAGDVEVYGPTTPAELDTLLTGNGIVVADSVSMCTIGGGQVVVLVIKAAQVIQVSTQLGGYVDNAAEKDSGRKEVTIVSAGDKARLDVTNDTPYTLLIENDANGNAVYVGKADPGSLSSASVWQVKRITWDANGNPTAVEWADGDAKFDNVWDDRAALSYSQVLLMAWKFNPFTDNFDFYESVGTGSGSNVSPVSFTGADCSGLDRSENRVLDCGGIPVFVIVDRWFYVEGLDFSVSGSEITFSVRISNSQQISVWVKQIVL